VESQKRVVVEAIYCGKIKILNNVKKRSILSLFFYKKGLKSFMPIQVLSCDESAKAWSADALASNRPLVYDWVAN
jgi:hypothetical protein